jgi:hypothetical protein
MTFLSTFLDPSLDLEPFLDRVAAILDAFFTLSKIDIFFPPDFPEYP